MTDTENPLQSFFLREDRGEVIFSYCGEITTELTQEAFQYVDASESLTGEKPSVRRAVFRAFVESFQNLFHHGDPPETGGGRKGKAGYGCIVLKGAAGRYRILTGNFLAQDEAVALQRQLDGLGKAFRRALRQQILNHLKSGDPLEKAGAGTGLLTLASLAESLDYSLVPFGTSQTFFTLRLEIGQRMNTPLKELVIPETPKTPFVSLSGETGQLQFTGRSIPENAIEFYQPVVEWIREFVETQPSGINLEVQMDYLNTSSSKCILDVFKTLGNLHQNGVRVVVDWIYEDEDEDMLEMGEDYQSIVDIPFHVISKSAPKEPRKP